MRKGIRFVGLDLPAATEGLLFYFAESEIEALCVNIRRILLEHGGCWITCDPEVTLIYITLLKIICGDRFMEILLQSNDRTVEKPDVKLGLNPITVRPQDIEQSMQEAMASLAQQGLAVERVLLKMVKTCEKGVCLTNANDEVRNVLEQTGMLDFIALA